jgi:hypothetical protein
MNPASFSHPAEATTLPTMRPLALLCLFAKEYAARKPNGMMLLQGECGMWSDDSFRDFVKIAALLKQDGWTNLTASQFVEKAGKR